MADEKCPKCGSSNVREATVWWSCLTCGGRWLVDELEIEVDELVPEVSPAWAALERAREAYDRANVQLQLEDVEDALRPVRSSR